MRILLRLFLLFSVYSQAQTCTVSYTYSGSADTYSFFSTSAVTNAHYYWNFGDGDGSNATNPIHIFPDDGEYIVTLYCHDTISNCSTYFEKWIKVNKPDTVACNLYFKDTIIGTNYLVTDLTSNCIPFYSRNASSGPCSYQFNCSYWAGWKSSLFISKLNANHAFKNSPNNAYVVYKEYFKTVRRDYSPAVNYQKCSANFEVVVNYQSSGALVKFTAMDKSATSYKWEIAGFGWPVYYYTQTISHFYPYPMMYQKSQHWIVNLQTTDLANNCGDTVSQNILIKNLNNVVYTDITEFDEIKLFVFPNPVTETLKLEISDYQNEQLKFTLYNSLGEAVKTGTIQERLVELNVSSLPSGLFFLKAENSRKQGMIKIIKE